MVKVVSVKFKNGGKPYYFAPNGKDEYQKGMGVIVETAKGLEYATVVQPECEVEDGEIVAPLKPVVRIATPRDEEQVKRNAEKRGEAMATAKEKIAARGLEMKLVDCEFAFDGSKVVFYFTSESRVDFRELIKDLSSAFHMRIELRQINIRDEIKLTGGLAPCGRECCCLGCMSEPKKVSVKMAKNQGLSLNPSKISGLCGRLMCCLSYEDEYYSEACKKVPKLGSTVDTPDGKGMVVNVNMLKMQVKVKIEQNDAVSYHDFGVDEIRFMRGNVVMGNEDLGAQSDEKQEELSKPDEDKAADSETKRGRRNDNRRHGGSEEKPSGDNQSFNRQGDRRDNRRDKGDNKRNQNNGGKQRGQTSQQGGESNRRRGGNEEKSHGNNNSNNNNNGNAGGSSEKKSGNNFKNKKRRGDRKNGGKPVQPPEGAPRN